jgi:hypothetical protein
MGRRRRHQAVGCNARIGKWTEDEGNKLNDAEQHYSGKDWVAIAALVPIQTEKECQNRWNSI